MVNSMNYSGHYRGRRQVPRRDRHPERWDYSVRDRSRLSRAGPVWRAEASVADRREGACDLVAIHWWRRRRSLAGPGPNRLDKCKIPAVKIAWYMHLHNVGTITFWVPVCFRASAQAATVPPARRGMRRSAGFSPSGRRGTPARPRRGQRGKVGHRPRLQPIRGKGT